MSIGLGLMSTLESSSRPAYWIAYQFLAGFGLGFGMQTSNLVVQRVLPFADVPTGIALMFFLQQLGGCIFTSVGQTILSNLLISQLSGIPGLNTTKLVNEGATNLASLVPSQYVAVVGRAYDWACTRIFLTAMGVSLAALLSSLGMEWKSIKKGKNGQGVLGESGRPTGRV